MNEFHASYAKAAEWLTKSFEANDFRGSSAWQSHVLHPARGWSHPYPETTGYIIPTAYDFKSVAPRHTLGLSRCIEPSIRWLLDLQLPSGAFPGGHQARDGRFRLSTRDYVFRITHPASPSIFNSGQILRGLTSHYLMTGDDATRQALTSCVEFLLAAIQADGRWSSDAYASATSPSYFAYVCPSLLATREITSTSLGEQIERGCIASLRGVTELANDADGFIRRMGFNGSDEAYTHTIGYTLAGLLESARLLGAVGAEFVPPAIAALDAICEIMEKKSRLPGSFGPGWRGDWSFSCVTGVCQLGLCMMDAFEITQLSVYRDAALRLCRSAMETQRRSGALPGSVPRYGKYMSLRNPNWAAKFYMDLVYRLRKESLTT